LIDYFALALTHALILIALLRILVRPELDREDFAGEVAEVRVKPDKRAAKRTRREGKTRGTGDA
jgi:hypothetical protein